jgi:alginate O-acetyltransferase complex protein AlgI
LNFNSFPFLILAVSAFALHYAFVSRAWQTAVLVAASLVFYAYGQPYLLGLLLVSASLSAVASFAVLRAPSRPAKVAWAAAGVALNLGVLAFFKYNRLLAGAISADWASLGGPGAVLLALPLPIGISFYTFHGISLVVDAFKRGALRPQDPAPPSFGAHLWRTLLYLTFFPQLIAGPIVKAHFFYPQIEAKRLAGIDWPLAARALLTGYFLKMVVADNLQDQTFWIAYPYFLGYSSANLAAFLFGYSMQIFADFAGYSLIAIGLAALFGYRLPQNFNFPYLSQSLSEFWTRWHMSLSAFLREYLYYPLGGNRKGALRTYANLMIVMTLGGLWHGAALSYAVWGAWHGMGLALERRFRASRFYRAVSLPAQAARVAFVFTFVSLAWLLFKLPNFGEAYAYLAALGRNHALPVNPAFLFLIGLYSVPVLAYHALHVARERGTRGAERFTPALQGLMLAAIVLNSGRPSAFIYFQF